MQIFVIQVDGKVLPRGYTSLKMACDEAQVNYQGALNGKRLWLKEDQTIRITEIGVEKISGRGRKGFTQ